MSIFDDPPDLYAPGEREAHRRIINRVRSLLEYYSEPVKGSDVFVDAIKRLAIPGLTPGMRVGDAIPLIHRELARRHPEIATPTPEQVELWYESQSNTKPQ